MKTLSKLALAAAILATASTTKAEWVSGHFRSSGAYAAPYYRMPANGIPHDNLSYRDHPSQQPGYTSPRTSSDGLDSTRPKTMPYYGGSGLDSGLLPPTGTHSPKLLCRRSGSFGSRL